ncbi:MAG: DUF177 domain-containing protein [Sulfitobacter sp.]
MSRNAPTDSAYRVSSLLQNSKTEFCLRPDVSELTRIAAELDLLALRKLSFTGYLEAQGTDDWRLQGRIGATVVQPCVVTLEPVTTRIDEDVIRVFQKHVPEIDLPEVEMTQDESVDALGEWIDPHQVMVEELALALPLYPRVEGSDLGEAIFTKPGEAPMTDQDARPFAGLAGLKDQLKPVGDHNPKDDDTSS